MKRILELFTSSEGVVWAGRAISAFAILLALPSLATWLGLPPEGDAVDYRIPLIRWMARHGTYPDWPWSYVDDFPMLGELLMLGLYVIHPNLMRLVPIAAYIGIGWAAGRLALSLSPQETKTKEKALFWFTCAGVLCLRPMALQSNLLMTDNLASFFALASLVFTLVGGAWQAGALIGLAMATRYFIWGSSLAIFLALAKVLYGHRSLYKPLGVLVLAGAIAPLPFLIRNLIVNGDPIYPLLAAKFQNFSLAHFGGGYGRGTGFLDFLLLPYDYLYTNTFVRGFYDYTLGKLFYVQLLVVISVVLFRFTDAVATTKRALARTSVQATLIFFVIHTLVWFFGSQQTRFYVAGLVLANITMLVLLFRLLPSVVLIALTMISALSVMSIQKDSILMAIGKKDTIFRKDIDKLADCLNRVDNPPLVGHTERFGALGFFDHEFVFTKGHVFAVPAAKDYLPEFSYGYQTESFLIPWPPENPCGWKKP